MCDVRATYEGETFVALRALSGMLLLLLYPHNGDDNDDGACKKGDDDDNHGVGDAVRRLRQQEGRYGQPTTKKKREKDPDRPFPSHALTAFASTTTSLA